MVVDMLLCGPKFDSFMATVIFPLTAYAAMTTSILIAIAFMIGRAISNPKLTLWSKTELIQLGVSLATIFIIITSVTTFCNIDIRSVETALGLTPSSPAGIHIYEAASDYLNGAATYTHNAVIVTRYELEAYTVLSYYNAFICDFPIGRIGLGCWYGWGGENLQPFGGYGATIAALTTAFNSLMVTYFTVINYIFILLFIYKGFAFFFLPVGIFMRSMPYMRHFGGVLLSISMAFMIVFPGLLAVFSIMGETMMDSANGFSPGDKMSTFNNAEHDLDQSGAEQFFVTSTLGEDYVKDSYIGGQKGDVGYALTFAAYAFIAGGFFPSVALLATIASISYLARLYGDEIDLSKIVQMV